MRHIYLQYIVHYNTACVSYTECQLLWEQPMRKMDDQNSDS